MDKFLELSFMNHIRNNDELTKPYEECFEPVIKELKELLSDKIISELEEELADAYTEALFIAGVLGMNTAIGIMNGTIKQVIE